MYLKNKLSKAVHLAIALGATSTLAISSHAIAQEGAEQVERIQVTGSRIKRSDMESASPVTVIDASAIAATGATSIDGVLQTLTAAGGAMTNPGINNGSGGNSRVNLRGLGSQRNLVLVNGRRMIASGTGAASTVDLNTIPVSMIQRIEVLKDGASAVYGTDAISGVVNVILKRDYEGMEMNVQGAISGEGDASDTSIDFTMGGSFDKGNVVFGVQYSDRGEAKQADRDFSNCPIAESTNDDGSIELYCAGSSYAQGGHIWGETADLSGRGGEYHDFVYSGDDNDRYNYSKDSYLFTPMQRLNLTLNGSYELSDTMTFFTEAMYTKRWSSQQMAPQPIWNSETWNYSSVWMNPDLLNHGIVEGEGLDYGRRMVESGTRDFDQVVDTVRLVLGVEGELDNGWYWDVSYNKGRNDSVDRLSNLHNIGSINEAVQLGNDLAAQGLTKEQILAAGAFDPFTQASWVGDSISPFIYTEQNAGGSEMDVFAATLSGEVFELPAGMIGFAAGYEHRLESAYYSPDSLTAQGLANDPRVEPTAGSFSVDEAYVEFAVPVVEDVAFADNIELSTAVRYFDYSTFGDDITWKLGLTWKLNEQVMLRSVASTAFRAPTVGELYGGKSPSFEQIVHPATTQTQAEVTVGGNELLTPEEADILTVGAVIEPEAIEGLSLTVDYYDIQITNAITAVSEQYIVEQCLGADGNNINSDTALCQAANLSMDGTGRVKFDNGLQNLGGINTAGVDLNIAYTFDAASISWRASLDSSFLSEYEEIDQDGVATDYKGFVTGGAGAYADVKTNFTLTAKSDNWDANYELRYISEVDSFACKSAPEKCYAPKVDAVTYHDVSGSYYLNDNLTLTGGINNLFDKQAPYYTGNNDSNTDPYTYDVLGRYFFVKANYKF